MHIYIYILVFYLYNQGHTFMWLSLSYRNSTHQHYQLQVTHLYPCWLDWMSASHISLVMWVLVLLWFKKCVTWKWLSNLRSKLLCHVKNENGLNKRKLKKQCSAWLFYLTAASVQRIQCVPSQVQPVSTPGTEPRQKSCYCSSQECNSTGGRNKGIPFRSF